MKLFDATEVCKTVRNEIEAFNFSEIQKLKETFIGHHISAETFESLNKAFELAFVQYVNNGNLINVFPGVVLLFPTLDITIKHNTELSIKVKWFTKGVINYGDEVALSISPAARIPLGTIFGFNTCFYKTADASYITIANTATYMAVLIKLNDVDPSHEIMYKDLIEEALFRINYLGWDIRNAALS